jgi:phospholipid N-methyltransferase
MSICPVGTKLLHADAGMDRQDTAKVIAAFHYLTNLPETTVNLDYFIGNNVITSSVCNYSFPLTILARIIDSVRKQIDVSRYLIQMVYLTNKQTRFYHKYFKITDH